MSQKIERTAISLRGLPWNRAGTAGGWPKMGSRLPSST